MLMGVVCLCNIFLFAFMTLDVQTKKPASKKTDLRTIITLFKENTILLLAIASSAFAFGIMNLLMTSSPLAMDQHSISFLHIAAAIKWHVIAMFLPSFFTGFFIKKFGLDKILIIGILLNIGAIIMHSLGTYYHHHFLGLVLLGCGWNFLFISGTTLLARVNITGYTTYLQGLNDTCNQFLMAFTALISALLVKNIGWMAVNYILLLPLLILVILWFMNRENMFLK